MQPYGNTFRNMLRVHVGGLSPPNLRQNVA